jgi:selenocysteine-specific elongation factor
LFVVGTAGHVDHGKSTLVKALTGIDPDRLQEEKEREMTIELGFAWLTLPSGREVSIVDVPGHERFVKNMLAGVGAIDAAILVIAADEGLMPQTEEHLAILDLLQVARGVVALTKSDLVDHEWLEMVREEIKERLKSTTLSEAPIVAVSSRTGAGLDDFRQALDAVLSDATEVEDRHRPRLSIDRVFSIAGFGTVTTGTLVDGRLQVGQEVEILPKGLRSRVRGLQIHKHKVESAGPGNHIAVNLGGVAVDQLSRGEVIALPGQFVPTRRLDARLKVLDDAPGPLVQNQGVDLFVGAAEIQARVTILDQEEIESGQTGWAQLRLLADAVVAKGDRFIIRQPSPSRTIGGGSVVDPHPVRHKRFQERVIASLETMEKGSPEELVLEALGDRAPVEGKVLRERSAMPTDEFAAALQRLLDDGLAIPLGADAKLATAPYYVSLEGWRRTKRAITSALGSYHRQFPLRAGMPKEELKSRLTMPARLFPLVMARAVQDQEVKEEATTFGLPGHEVRFSPDQERQAKEFLARLEASPYAPPSLAETGVPLETVQALVDQGSLVKLAEGLYFPVAVYRDMVERVLNILREKGTITVAEVRDAFGTSRRYALALLEHLDDERVTRRLGDERVLR